MSEQAPEEEDKQHAALVAEIDAAYAAMTTEIDAAYAQLLAEYGGEEQSL
jgi:hypothetical protein